MNKEIAEKWALALESGKYTQTEGMLKNKNGHCCLGVLCELALESGVPLKEVPLSEDAEELEATGIFPEQFGLTTNDIFTFDGRSEVPPKSVIEWAGLNSDCGLFDYKNIAHAIKALSVMNDRGASFKEIAALIRKHVDEL